MNNNLLILKIYNQIHSTDLLQWISLHIMLLRRAVLAALLISTITPLAIAQTGKVTEPSQMNQAFADAYNSKDIKRIMALYEKEAKLSSPKGQIISGFKAIETDHKSFLLKLGGFFTTLNISTVIYGDIALLNATWKIQTKNAKGKNIVLRGVTSEVVRRQKDGSWLYIIDNPYPPTK